MKIVTDLEFLRQKSSPMTKEEAEQTGIFRQLEMMLRSEGGIGLSAIQIGIPKAACIIRLPDCYVNLLNPKIIEQKDEVISIERCLSVPGVSKKIKRFNEVHITDDLHPPGYVFTGVEAFCFLHEFGHLNGRTILDEKGLEPVRVVRKPLPNDKCPCGSGRKYKKCCEAKKIFEQQVLFRS